MGQKYMDSAKASAEADRIASIATQNLKQVLLSFRNCLHIVHETRRMLEVDPSCVCVNPNDGESKWERRRELHEAADSIEIAMEIVLRNSLNEIETNLVDHHRTPDHGTVSMETLPDDMFGGRLSLSGEESLLWCDRVCVHEKVDMDCSLWCNTPQTILELVFARLPLHQIFQLRGLSKHWRSSIMSPSFQNAFGTTTSRRFAIIAGTVRKRLWSFGTTERKWYTLPFDFLPTHCDFPVAGDGGLLCCRRPALPSRSSNPFQQPKQDLQLYVCNPLTQAWRKLPLPSKVQEVDLVHLVTNPQTKHYTITVLDDLQQQKHHHDFNTKPIVEVYDSQTNTWTTNTSGIFRCPHHNNDDDDNHFIYYKKYISHKFIGIRAYNKMTGHTSEPRTVPKDIFFAEGKGFFPLAEYQGRVYVVETEAERSGVWVLQGHEWEKVCEVPKPESLKFYLLSLYVSAEVIIISGDKRVFHDDVANVGVGELEESEPEPEPEPEGAYIWMLDRGRRKWIDVVDHELDSVSCSQVMFEMRLDGVP